MNEHDFWWYITQLTANQSAQEQPQHWTDLMLP